MTTPLSANETLEREFLLVRAKLLEVAATLDRIERGDGSAANDPRLKQIAAALEVLQQPLANKADRAEAIQMIFSLPYKESWREEFQIATNQASRPA